MYPTAYFQLARGLYSIQYGLDRNPYSFHRKQPPNTAYIAIINLIIIIITIIPKINLNQPSIYNYDIY